MKGLTIMENEPFKQCLGQYEGAFSSDCLICKVVDCSFRKKASVITAVCGILMFMIGFSVIIGAVIFLCKGT